MKSVMQGLQDSISEFHRKHGTSPTAININPEDLAEYASNLIIPSVRPVRKKRFFKFNVIPLIECGGMPRGKFGMLDKDFRARCVRNTVKRVLEIRWDYSKGAIPLPWLDRVCLVEEIMRLRRIIKEKSK